ncbi:methylmalonate-semialdehyde dehydrogenase [Aspergillus heteromorphus CBS 117.55]|uniref:methylmalonate-semialdehyde dehydrogenase (CoA acylating) n=1 Tax=Aspergillus heteromorphus CBS 117.55 TaxID=1448321 RepID=A0A317WBM3_9EURO|nr:methylmalonate-semialdehyde dehydrogenase [Aspergillus heteromorphus CBS 117.55]PWY83599.1 methylmalonate-semialdehyde dehydrogenase [Aspergillus heteromorphus CBS 117.55]
MPRVSTTPSARAAARFTPFPAPSPASSDDTLASSSGLVRRRISVPDTRHEGRSTRSPRARTVSHRDSEEPEPEPEPAPDEDDDRDEEENEEEEEEPPAPPTITHLFINNTRVMSRSQNWTNVIDPVCQRLLCRVPGSTLQEVQRAVDAAEEAQPAWVALGFKTRREHLLRLVDVLRQMSPEIVTCLSREVGKTLADADAEVFRGLDCIHAACSIGPEMAGMFLGGDATLLQTFYEPVGVCVSISPFSFPFMIPLWSLPYALITGNTVILKPSEKTPTTSSLLAEAFLKAGFPPGVFNVLHGGPSTVQMLVSQPSVQAVSFVGSESAARQVHDLARAAGKRVQAECGGKNHGVVLEDANMMSTLFAIAGSAFGAAGQRCMALSVAVFVGQTRDWIPQLVGLAQSMVVGCGGDQESKIGPLIDETAKNRVSGIIRRAVAERATVLLDGRDIQVPGYPDGNFLGPTILSGVETYMECYQAEIFGPVLICMEVDTLEEAIELINQNKYGNGCSIFTTSGKHANTFQRCVNVGQIGVNIPLIAPYGTAVRTSNKDSFLGDRNTPGKTYWPFFTTTKTVSSRWDQ